MFTLVARKPLTDRCRREASIVYAQQFSPVFVSIDLNQLQTLHPSSDNHTFTVSNDQFNIYVLHCHKTRFRHMLITFQPEFKSDPNA